MNQSGMSLLLSQTEWKEEPARILVVDDRPGNLMMMVEILKDLGHPIVTASSGSEALRILMQQEFTVILLDVNMPGVDGFELSKLIREREKSARVPIIFVTAISMGDAQVTYGYSLGAVDYVFSPVVPEVLRAKVSVFVDLRNKTRQLERAAAHLQTSEEKTRAMLGAIPDLMFEMSHDGVLLSYKAEVNSTTRAAAMLGKHVSEAFPPVVSQLSLRMLAQALETRTIQIEDYSLEVNNSKRQYEARVVPISTDRAMALIRDITDRKIAEQQQQLRAAMEEVSRVNAELRQFAYAASHDLRAPLRAIDSLSTWLEQDLAAVLTSETKKYMQLLRGRVRRMDHLLTDLLEYSRAGRGEQKLEIVNPNDLISEVVEMCNMPEAFVVETDLQAPRFMTAVLPLKRVLMNLLGNAIKHHDRKTGSIKICAADRGDTVEFSISDDGPGIPPQFQKKAFEMFQTLQSRDTIEGSGMGLALVKKLVETARGVITLESQGRGATFRFTWPKRWDVKAEQQLILPEVSYSPTAPSRESFQSPTP